MLHLSLVVTRSHRKECFHWQLNGDSFSPSFRLWIHASLSFFLPLSLLLCCVFTWMSLLHSCVYVCVCMCIWWVCRGIIGLNLCGMKFIKVSGVLWWKLCEGISTMTIARVHAKSLVFSRFLMKILPSYFGSQGLNIAITFAVYTVSWIGKHLPLGWLWELESSKSCLACWESVQASIYLLCPWRQIPYSICICSTQFPFGNWLIQCFPISTNVLPCCYQEADNRNENKSQSQLC